MELPASDQPPEEIWLDQDALNEHFERVHARYGGDDDGGHDAEVVPMTQNELTRDLRRA